MLTVSRVAGVGVTEGVAVTVEVGVNSGEGVGVSTGGSITTSVGVGGNGVGIGVGSDCWHADNTAAMTSEETISATIREGVRVLRGITKSRIRIRQPMSFAD